ncbi:MAG TPA: hypothetical protein VN041_13140 [Microbacterium sp.]|nr:hypothetical protein [Microbacterium sp.]
MAAGDWVKVDAWLVAPSEAGEYVRRREALALAVLAEAERRGLRAGRAGKGSEDGEYVIASDAAGETAALVHLDPMTTDEWAQASARDRLTDFFARHFAASA